LIYIVIVRYGDWSEGCNLPSFIDDYDVEILNIRTDKNTTINRFSEFSGYQYGLEQVLSSSDSNFLNIVFINDTFFSSHLKILAHSLLNDILKRLSKNKNQMVSGYSQALHQAPVDNMSFDLYFSTWIFALSFERSSMSDFSFYSYKGVEIDLLKERLSKGYLSQNLRWLQPESFFRGWHKAIPYKTIAVRDLNRKMNSIIIEHMLLYQLKTIYRFKSLDFSMNGSLKYKVYFMFDRIFVNIMKIKFRLNFYITRLLS